jgi:methyl-accepting chemotaxis protein
MNPHEQLEHDQSGQQDAKTPQVVQASAGNVDKIRDILFGSQMRDYESRFARLEETLLKETADLRENSRRRFEQLETFVKKELEAMEGRLKVERDERTDVAGQHSRELKEMHETFHRRLRDLDDRGSHVERDLRDQLLQNAKNLTEAMRSHHEELAEHVERRFQELRHGKTDRAALASLFNEVALRLNDQFQIPGADH